MYPCLQVRGEEDLLGDSWFFWGVYRGLSWGFSQGFLGFLGLLGLLGGYLAVFRGSPRGVFLGGLIGDPRVSRFRVSRATQSSRASRGFLGFL